MTEAAAREMSERAIDDFIGALWIEDGLAANGAQLFVQLHGCAC